MSNHLRYVTLISYDKNGEELSRKEIVCKECTDSQKVAASMLNDDDARVVVVSDYTPTVIAEEILREEAEKKQNASAPDRDPKVFYPDNPLPNMKNHPIGGTLDKVLSAFTDKFFESRWNGVPVFFANHPTPEHHLRDKEFEAYMKEHGINQAIMFGTMKPKSDPGVPNRHNWTYCPRLGLPMACAICHLGKSCNKPRNKGVKK